VEYDIVKVTDSNYYMFDDMIFYRGHERYKNEDELKETRDFTAYYTALQTQSFHVFTAN